MPLTCDKPEAFFIRTRARITYYNKGSNNIVVFLTIQYYCLPLRHE